MGALAARFTTTVPSTGARSTLMPAAASCAAVPVFDRFGVVIAGLSISFPTLRFSEERLQEYVAMLHTAARKISAQMGYHDYPF